MSERIIAGEDCWLDEFVEVANPADAETRKTLRKGFRTVLRAYTANLATHRKLAAHGTQSCPICGISEPHRHDNIQEVYAHLERIALKFGRNVKVVELPDDTANLVGVGFTIACMIANVQSMHSVVSIINNFMEKEFQLKQGFTKEEKKTYWCCAADFGKHEPTCKNYVAAQPSEAAGVRRERFEEAKLWREAFQTKTSGEMCAWILQRWTELEQQPLTPNAGEMWLEDKIYRMKLDADKDLHLEKLQNSSPTKLAICEARVALLTALAASTTQELPNAWAGVMVWPNGIKPGAAKEAGGEFTKHEIREARLDNLAERAKDISSALKQIVADMRVTVAAAPNRETELRDLKSKMDKMCSFLPAGHSFCMLRDELEAILAADKPQPPAPDARKPFCFSCGHNADGLVNGLCSFCRARSESQTSGIAASPAPKEGT